MHLCGTLHPYCNGEALEFTDLMASDGSARAFQEKAWHVMWRRFQPEEQNSNHEKLEITRKDQGLDDVSSRHRL
jgi:hypothetical protein